MDCRSFRFLAGRHFTEVVDHIRGQGYRLSCVFLSSSFDCQRNVYQFPPFVLDFPSINQEGDFSRLFRFQGRRFHIRDDEIRHFPEFDLDRRFSFILNTDLFAQALVLPEVVEKNIFRMQF